jgi:hypothetical protein
MLFIPHTPDLSLLGGREGRGPASDPAAFPCRLQPILRPFNNPLPFELSDRCENVKHQPSSRGGRIDVFPDGPEPGTASLDQVDDFEKVFQAPGQTIVFGDNDNVAISEFLHHLVQFWTGPGGSGDRICEYPFRTCGQ